jgi:hypothetical protein
MYALASLIIEPQLGNGGGTPIPKKLSAPSAKITIAIPTIATAEINPIK